MIKSRHALKKIPLIGLISIAAILDGPVSMAQSPEELLKLIGGFDQRTWTGEFTIIREGSENQSKTSNQGRGPSYEKVRYVYERVVVSACGQIGKLRIIKARRELTDTMTRKMDNTGNSQILCDPPKSVMESGGFLKRNKNARPFYGPGPTSHEYEERKYKLCGDKGAPSVKDTASVTILQLGGKKWMISGVSNALVTESSIFQRTETAACTGKEKKITTRVIPGKYGEPGSVSVPSGTDENNLDTTTILPPYPMPLLFTEQFEMEEGEDVISDEKLVSEIKPAKKGGYREKIMAYWTFKAPCAVVYDEMMNDLAYAEAFLDPAAQGSAKNIEDYLSKVDLICYEIYFGKPYKPPTGKKNKNKKPKGSNNASTDVNCKKDMKEYRKWITDTCRPEIMYDATDKHEDEHVRQCLDYHKEYVSGIPRHRGIMEVNAYVIQLKIYLDWLKTNCPKYKDRLGNARERVNKIENITDNMPNNFK